MKLNAAMELLAMDMKARGLFVSRALSFEGCGFEIHRCNLSAAERAVYDAAADFWLRMLEVIEKCTRLTSDHGGSTPRYFWGAHQAFFKQLLNSVKAPELPAASVKLQAASVKLQAASDKFQAASGK